MARKSGEPNKITGRKFLESGMNDNLWIANRYVSGDQPNGGKNKGADAKDHCTGVGGWHSRQAATNEDKSEVLARLMFPQKPQQSFVP